MSLFFFVSDLHGSQHRYEQLFARIELEKPDAVFLGGDLLPSGLFHFTSKNSEQKDFLTDIFLAGFKRLKKILGSDYPKVFLILGNDDGKFDESFFISEGKTEQLWYYLHAQFSTIFEFEVFGYSYVPPTPFLLKDWERYDVSRYVDPDCISPEEGKHSSTISPETIKYSTIQKDLDNLSDKKNITNTICLFHSPPYQTNLDRVANDNKFIDYVPLDLHAGSIAIKRFIENKQPLITLHGHIHESAKLTGSWNDKIGKTFLFSAAHDGRELALIRFDPHHPGKATRELL
jgi:Icc-related predicted phosphoesterase